jgi:hypothetical protein
MDTAAEFRKHAVDCDKMAKGRRILKLRAFGDGWQKDGFCAPSWRKMMSNH